MKTTDPKVISIDRDWAKLKIFLECLLFKQIKSDAVDIDAIVAHFKRSGHTSLEIMIFIQDIIGNFLEEEFPFILAAFTPQDEESQETTNH
jgi:hypothetical protein